MLTAAVTVFGLKLVGADFSPLAGNASYRQFLSAYTMLTQQYYKQLSTTDLFHGAIHGMLTAIGDPFSVYMNPAMTAQFREMVTSQFQGIGAVLTLESGQVVVRSVLSGSPAQKVGLQVGDALVQINGKSTAAMSLEEAVSLIRGPSGTRVRIEVLRGDKHLSMTVARASVHESTVYAKMLPERIGYILISQFSDDTAQAFERDLSILRHENMRGLIIDVRDDPGGLLQSVGKIADSLLPKDKPIVQIMGRDNHPHVLRATGSTVGVPVVCLIDGGSASAAEILAAALSESGHVALIGEVTYGKGTVQETEDFSDGSSIKLTVARWLTPDGVWIHKKGIRPTISVPTPSYFRLPPLPMSFRRPLSLDSNSVWVAVLQRMLLALGYDPSRTDGYFNTGTQQAVKAFQRMHRMPVTGQVDRATAYMINVAVLAKRQRQDPQLAAAVGYLESKLMK